MQRCKNCLEQITQLDCGTYVHQTGTSTGSFLCSQIEAEILDGTTVAEPFRNGDVIGFKLGRIVTARQRRAGESDFERVAGIVRLVNTTGSIIVKLADNRDVCFTPAPWFEIEVLHRASEVEA